MRLEGDVPLLASMNKAEKRLTDMGSQYGRTAQTIASRGRSTAPRRTGALAASVGGSGQRMSAEVRSQIVYAGVIHWGWPAHGIEPQPWLSDAAQATEPQWIDYHWDEVDSIVTMMASST